MSYESQGAEAPVDGVCRYGASRLFCRGPERPLAVPYHAFLGDGETFGRFVRRPFPALVERETGRIGVNLGCVNAGLDAYLGDAPLMEIVRRASPAVIQVMGAQNLTNPFYTVHPRRNDRFLAPTPALRTLYPDIDFTEYHFNRHLVSTLCRRGRGRFEEVAAALRARWSAAMGALIDALDAPPVLLWLRYRELDPPRAPQDLGGDPMLVSRAMIDALAPRVAAIVELTVEPAGVAGELATMAFSPLQAPAAAQTIGQRTHYEIAKALADLLDTDADAPAADVKRPAGGAGLS